MNDREFISMTAAMEGDAVVVANIGQKKKVSEMELICLVNFAEIGVMSLFAALDGEEGEAAAKELDQHLDAIRRVFAKRGNDGLNRLSQSITAMLRSERFEKYVVTEATQ